MKIATYNIQNIFHRHVDLINKNQESKSGLWTEEFENLLRQDKHTEGNYERMRELTDLLDFNRAVHEPYVSMKNFKGNLHVKQVIETMDVKATNLTDWNGWARIKTVPIARNSIINKSKVVEDVDADILILQQVEDRDSLTEFNELLSMENQKVKYQEIVHLAGNDSKGLGMGILLKTGYCIRAMRSYSSERDINGNPLFDTDLQQYKIETLDGGILFILCVQLVEETRSKEKLDTRQKRQAIKVAGIYQKLWSEGHQNILIVGTFNAPSYSDSISPIMQMDVMDIARHESFEVIPDTGDDAGYFRMGAYRKGVNIEQKDYLIISPALQKQVSNCGMNRKAMWPLKKPEWVTYDSVENERDSASDHPLLWAEFTIEDSRCIFKKSA